MAKRVFITGANQGIGFYMVKELLHLGYVVTVVDLEIDGLEKLLEEDETNLLAIRCDVRDNVELVKAVEDSVKKFGGIDLAIHNACLCTFQSLEETSDEVYRDVFDVNYFGAVSLTRAVVPYMEQAGVGKILFTSSGVGVMGFVNISPYASSKGAIESFAKCMNIEYQGTGITFHLLQPPLTRTKSASGLPVPQEIMADPEKVGRGLARNIEKKHFLICHSFGQRVQTRLSYLFPVTMGKLMSKATSRYLRSQE